MTILNGIEDAVVKLDGQANFAAMNQAAMDIYQRLGLDPHSMKGKSMWELFPSVSRHHGKEDRLSFIRS